MAPSVDRPASGYQAGDGNRSEFISPDLLRRVEEALRKVGDFGVVRLVVAEGQVRSIEATQTKGISDRPEALDESPRSDSFGCTTDAEAPGGS